MGLYQVSFFESERYARLSSSLRQNSSIFEATKQEIASADRRLLDGNYIGRTHCHAQFPQYLFAEAVVTFGGAGEDFGSETPDLAVQVDLRFKDRLPEILQELGLSIRSAVASTA